MCTVCSVQCRLCTWYFSYRRYMALCGDNQVLKAPGCPTTCFLLPATLWLGWKQGVRWWTVIWVLIFLAFECKGIHPTTRIPNSSVLLLLLCPPLSQKSRVRRWADPTSSSCRGANFERLNSNSRVAFDHQIGIIIIKSKKSKKKSKK